MHLHRLYADVKKYAEFGEHRTASFGDRDTGVWLASELKRSGIPLGLKPDTLYPPGNGVKLERGDTVLLLTDGIDEAMSPDNTIFGIERALEIVRTHRSKTARELVETLYAGVRRFSQNTPQQDDVTAVVIKAV